MKYKQTFLFLVFLLAVFSLSKIRFLDDVVGNGDEVEIFTSVVNNGNNNANDVRVITYFPELGEIYYQNRFTVEDNYNKGTLNWFDLPSSVPAGDYLVRVAASNDDYRSHKYRYITVE